MVSEATLKKHMNSLVTLYLKHYVEKYDRQPAAFNRHRDKWGFESMVQDLGYERAQEVVEYYFKTNRPLHPVQYLLYNYDKLDILMKEYAKDELDRAELRRLTEKRVKEWNGNT